MSISTGLKFGRITLQRSLDFLFFKLRKPKKLNPKQTMKNKKITIKNKQMTIKPKTNNKVGMS